ncbi:TonB-dependent receptor [Ramlibacter sp. XY19]|uniref:TonB-dependent receptor n=1 Tax=Ramlibacter paludis TaxID=2908000 RepID=UPI0023DC58AC|nr:TonB-dependent receptor [Ramlibacter paludis]MCG2593503.1 TonB-dependent receptor [Ramlibacter paludis]
MNSDNRNFRRTVVAHAALVAICGSAAMVAPQVVFAQQTLQRVEVTGSSIRRSDAETASPVQVISKDEIDQSGKATVGEYLQTLTADSQGSVPFTYGRGFAGATASGISLRGLGANATLVLINGRRVASSVLADDAQRAFVDLNQIPMEAVERVEVLKDGASAIYGSDAVAGVVNIILKKNYVGTVVKATGGIAEEGDGSEGRLSLTHGMGDIEKDGWNLILNAEISKKNAIYYKDRTGRNSVGVSAIGTQGFDPNGGPGNNINRYGGNGWIPSVGGVRQNNSASQSLIGNVRNPVTLDYYSRQDPAGVGFTRTMPNAAAFCASHANIPQNNPNGACINDMWQQFGQVQPDMNSGSFFGRFTKAINAQTEGFVELGYYQMHSRIQNTPLVPSGTIFTPAGDVISNTAATQLGAAHPDNPYFGTAARLSYNPGFEIGPNINSSDSHTVRVVAGVKGSVSNWDYDTALSYSEVKQTDTSEKRINWRVSNALLNPTAANVAAATANSAAYAALPAGTFWRIGENAWMNSPAMYNALLADQSRSGFSKQYGIDFKASTELGKLDGGAIGLAIGGEVRHEANNLPFYSGLGDYIGVSLTKYSGDRNIYALFTEALFPVTKRLELSAALRADHYSDAGSAFTPKVGAKWRPIDNLALRGTYAEGFRAPGFAENSTSSIAAFGGAVVNDNVRCAAGVPNSQCLNVAPTFVQRGNPDLEPEKSKSFTLGAVWDITPKTSLTADLWEIRRTGLPVIQDPQQAVDNGQYTRDPATAVTPTDPGAILTGFVSFENSASSKTNGLDVELKHRWDLGDGMGRLNGTLTWTHLFTQRVVDSTGVAHDYAGTHGDCNITNCMGTPKDRIQFVGSWDWNQWRLGAIVNYRGSMSNKLEKSDTACAQTFLNGNDAPDGCKVKSFTTLDLSVLYRLGKNTEIFGSVQNVFDSKPPSDYETYGAIGYNPLDYSGAIGRFWRVGMKHKF